MRRITPADKILRAGHSMFILGVMNAFPQAPALPRTSATDHDLLKRVHGFPAKSLLWLGATILLAACATERSNPRMSSHTLYLRNADAEARAWARAPRGTPVPKPVPKSPAGVPSQISMEATPAPEAPRSGIDQLSEEQARSIDRLLHGAHGTEKPHAEEFSTMQARLLKRISTLSNDQADSACLILQIIPRENVFDRGINPRAKLLDYTRLVNTVNDLIDIEKAIDNPMGRKVVGVTR